MLFRKIENIRIKTEEKIRGVGYANADRNIILNKGEVMYNNRKNKQPLKSVNADEGGYFVVIKTCFRKINGLYCKSTVY